MKFRKVKRITPIRILPGDSIEVTYTEKYKDGHITQTLIDDKIDSEIYAENVGIIDIDAGDFPGYGKGIGGVLLESQEPSRGDAL